MFSCVIIDDEAHNRDTLARLVQRYCPGVRVIGKASGVGSGLDLIRELKPDLIFLDINLADGTGFDLLHSLMPAELHVIFVSAMDKNMVRAFRLSGMEFLLKPVDPGELVKGIERAMKTEPAHFSMQLQALEQDMQE